MRSLLVLCSYHHNNTEKIAAAMTKVLGAEVRNASQTSAEEIREYDLVGFGSGIYDAKHHRSLLALADGLPHEANKKVFIFSTNGTPAIAVKAAGKDGVPGSELNEYEERFHTELREKLRSKGCTILGEFSCPGWNTNSFLRLFGGINKGRPSAEDLARAEEFARSMLSRMK